MEISCVLIELKSGSRDKVRKWVEFILENKAEALSTLEHEKVTIESFFLTEINEADYLIGYMRTPSMELAQEAVKKSTSKVDEFHQLFKRETWVSGKNMELLFDLSRITDEEKYA